MSGEASFLIDHSSTIGDYDVKHCSPTRFHRQQAWVYTAGLSICLSACLALSVYLEKHLFIKQQLYRERLKKKDLLSIRIVLGNTSDLSISVYSNSIFPKTF